MHTFQEKDVYITHNSDLSGEVLIGRCNPGGPLVEVSIPGSVLLRFVAAYVRDEWIAKLEQSSDAAILGIDDGNA